MKKIPINPVTKLPVKKIAVPHRPMHPLDVGVHGTYIITKDDKGNLYINPNDEKEQRYAMNSGRRWNEPIRLVMDTDNWKLGIRMGLRIEDAIREAKTFRGRYLLDNKKGKLVWGIHFVKNNLHDSVICTQ